MTYVFFCPRPQSYIILNAFHLDNPNLQKMKSPTRLSLKKAHLYARSNTGTSWQGKNGEGTGDRGYGRITLIFLTIFLLSSSTSIRVASISIPFIGFIELFLSLLLIGGIIPQVTQYK